MKKLFTLIAALLFAATVWAQSGCPQRMSYQAVVRNAANELVTSKTGIKVKIEITDGTKSYKEYHTVNSNQNGLISLMVGEGSSVEGTMEGMNWLSATFTTTVTVPGESAVTATTTVEAVPYALYACDINPEGVNITKIKTDINYRIDTTAANSITRDDILARRLVADSLFQLKQDTILAQSIKDTVLKHLENGASAINHRVDTIVDNHIQWATDTLISNRELTDSLNIVRGTIQADVTNLVTNYYDKQAIDQFLNGIAQEDPHNLVDIYSRLNKDSTRLTKDSTYLKGLIDNLSTHTQSSALCDSVKGCVTGWIADSMQVVRDSLSDIRTDMGTLTTKLQGNIDSTSQHVRDFVTENYVTAAAFCDKVKNECIPDVISQVSTNTANIAANASKIYSDSTAIMKHVSDTAAAIRASMGTATDDLSDRMNTLHDSIQTNLTSIESLQSHTTKAALCDSVNDCVAAAMNARHFLTSDSTVIKTMRDSIQINKNAIATNATNIATNTTNITTNTDNIATNTSDIATLKLTNFDTIYNKSAEDAKLHLTKNYGFKIFNWKKLPNDEAAVYIINQSADTVNKTSALTAKDNDVNPSMTAFLVGKDPTSGQAAVIGTVNQGENPVMGALGYSKNGQAAAVMANGPIAFSNGHFATDINNTGALPATPSNTTLVTEATLSGSIQNLASVATTIPTTVAELTDAGDYAKLASDNSFSGQNTFSGDVTFSDTVIVPSGFNFTTTTTETCNNIAVNACDLLTVFDSIQRQFTALRAEIDGLRDSLQRLRGAVAPTFTSMNFERDENSLTATATFDDGGATITEYNFCISTSEDMSNATCQTTTNANFTFEGLQAGSQYYVTVAATNLKGTTTSDAQAVQTVHARPVLGEPTATPVSNTEIKVEGELTDMGGSTPTTVTVYAYTNSDYSDAEPIHGTDSIITSVPKDYKVNVGGLAKGTQYYLAVIADNGEKKDTVKASATTLNIIVTVTSDKADTILTGSNVDVTVKYTATVSGIDAAEDGYSWKVNDTDSTSTSHELTVRYTEAGTYTVVCAYNDATDTAVTVLVVMDTITFVPNGGFGEMYKQIVERGVETNLSAYQFTHEGWTFKGWSDDCDNIVTYEGSNRTLSYTDGASITTEGNVKLYAVWATSCTGTKGSNETGENGKVFSVKDVCNNDYAVVEIGNQCWMKENLRTTKYNDNTEIENDKLENDNGILSYKQSIVTRICPTGWHTPSKDEWNVLFDYVKGNNDLICGTNGYAKALATPCDWELFSGNPNACAISDKLESNNATGFSMIPYGENLTGSVADYWTSTDDYWFVDFKAQAGSASVSPIFEYLLLVRCLRD